jgi:hypothetical protein
MRAVKVWLVRLGVVAVGLLIVGAAVGAAVILVSEDDKKPPAQGATAEPAILLAAGDIGDCNEPGDEATAKLLAEYPTATIAALGDMAYQHGSPADYQRCFEPSWGPHKDRMRPTPGNHDYGTTGAAGYFGYFGEAAGNPEEGWYSYDYGGWHMVSLNSECRRVGGCEPTEPQAQWLEADLRRTSETCQLAYFHRPPFTSGRYSDETKNLERMRVLWRILHEHGVEVVLVGHEHSYERFAPMGPDGEPDPQGPRLFVVGTGGGNLRDYDNPPLPTTEVRNSDTWGLLKLSLLATGYRWEFLPALRGSFQDSGSGSCR